MGISSIKQPFIITVESLLATVVWYIRHKSRVFRHHREESARARKMPARDRAYIKKQTRIEERKKNKKSSHPEDLEVEGWRGKNVERRHHGCSRKPVCLIGP